MAITNGYATLEELQTWNEATKAKSVSVLERAIEACSRGIDRYTQRTFFQATGTRLFDAGWVDDDRGCRVQAIDLGAFNDLAGIVSLKTDDDRDGVFETTWAPADYQLFPLNPTAGPEQRPYEEIRAVGTKAFPEPTGPGRVGLAQVDGTWGWPAIPHDINQACLIHASRVFYRKDTPHGVAGWGAFGEIRVGRTDPDVVAFLDPFQRYGGVGIA